MRPAVVLVVPAVALSGCASWLERPLAGLRGPGEADGRTTVLRRFEPPIPCGAGPYPSRYEGPRREIVDIGPLRFQGLGTPYGPERFAPGAPALTIPVDVPARARAVIEVATDSLDVAGLDTDADPADTVAAAHRAVRCFTGEFSQVQSVSFVVDGARCVPISVTMRGVRTTRLVPFGVRRCPG